MSRLPQLELLAEQNLLSALDLHFAELMCRLSADSSPELSLAAALASNAIAQGHVCLQLPSWAGSRLGNPPIYSLPSLTAWHNHLRGCAVVGEPGIPRVSIGSIEPVLAALLAASGATTPSTLPFPKVSGSFDKVLATP